MTQRGTPTSARLFITTAAIALIGAATLAGCATGGHLVDGGSAALMPVRLPRAMGAGTVIAVEPPWPLASRSPGRAARSAPRARPRAPTPAR
jgi:predicted acylesterase/phospholipase RssA